MQIISGLLFILLQVTLAQYTCPKFACGFVNDTDLELCAVNDNGNIKMKVCRSDQTDFCDFKINQPSSNCAEKFVSLYSLTPGDPCDTDEMCISKKCNLGHCVGMQAGEMCATDNDCNPGLYCSQRLKCEALQTQGKKCGPVDGPCMNELACTLGSCISIGSLADESPSDNMLACKSLFTMVDKNGVMKCHSQPKSTTGSSSPTECTLGSMCTYKFDSGTETLTIPCKCGANKDGKSYCHQGVGNMAGDLTKVNIYFHS
jgi:hypothetical protein